MKVAISVPDPIFRDAEKMAKRLGLSRSELYTRALRALVTEDAQVTEAPNRVYAEDPGEVDPILRKLQRKTLTRADW